MFLISSVFYIRAFQTVTPHIICLESKNSPSNSSTNPTTQVDSVLLCVILLQKGHGQLNKYENILRVTELNDTDVRLKVTQMS